MIQLLYLMVLSKGSQEAIKAGTEFDPNTYIVGIHNLVTYVMGTK